MLKPEHLAAASSRAILMRVLTNLKAIYLQRGDHARAHLALDRIVTLAPNAAGALKERGLVAAKLGAAEAAREDLERVPRVGSVGVGRGLDPRAAGEAVGAWRQRAARSTDASGRGSGRRRGEAQGGPRLTPVSFRRAVACAREEKC